ncbi:MAG: uL15 family ribosomal protein [Candidatus Paceibacterota bacterium]|jgi:large subunit ribosomal protein L15
MRINDLKPKTKTKNVKRIGRGGKRGTYSGRGQKGQKSRAGRRIKPALKEAITRLPKIKGLKNKSLKTSAKVINLGDLEKRISGAIINRKVLIDCGLIRASEKNIKILSDGEISKAFEISEIAVSEKAKGKIEKAGGKIL